MTQFKYVLWGFHPAYCNGQPIKITGADSVRSLSSESKTRQHEGWTLAIYKGGESPDSLIFLAKCENERRTLEHSRGFPNDGYRCNVR